MNTDAIIARIEELEDLLRTLDRSREKLVGEIMGLTDELCERDVHDFEDEVREFGDGGEIHFIVCQNCGNREQNGVVEPD